MNENILPFPKTADPAFASGAAAPPSNVILFPAASVAANPPSNIVVLPAPAFISSATSPAPDLPGDEPVSEKSARLGHLCNVSAWTLRRGHNARKRPARRSFQTAEESRNPAGTSDAKLSTSMDPATQPTARTSEGEISSEECRGEHEFFQADGSRCLESAAREPDAMEWHEGRPVRSIDRSAPEFAITPAPFSTATADRIFLLLLREALLARQYGSDSMAVLLRPDEDTELVLHLSQRQGRLAATVRCERGDLPLLRASWAQVQETMALQRVDVSPLQEPIAFEAADSRRDARNNALDASPFSPARGPDMDSMDEWPRSASHDASSAHRRGQRQSGTHLTTSRPGWETWA